MFLLFVDKIRKKKKNHVFVNGPVTIRDDTIMKMTMRDGYGTIVKRLVLFKAFSMKSEIVAVLVTAVVATDN